MSNRDGQAISAVVGSIAAILGFMAGLIFGHCGGQGAARSEAVKAGVGRWECDRETGTTTFKYGVFKAEAGR